MSEHSNPAAIPSEPLFTVADEPRDYFLAPVTRRELHAWAVIMTENMFNDLGLVVLAAFRYWQGCCDGEIRPTWIPPGAHPSTGEQDCDDIDLRCMYWFDEHGPQA